jgi:hypothetical protein
MFDDHVPDMGCVPYRRKPLYLILTVPFLVVLILVGVYLWRFSPWLTAAMAFFYLWTCFFQAYWCAAQDCPYVGRFCPAVAGIVPASWIAKWLYGGREVHASRARLEIHAVLAVLGMLAWTILPLWWIAKLSIGLAVAYVVWQLAYVVVFWLTICPVCAIRETCPGGVLQRRCFRQGDQ